MELLGVMIRSERSDDIPVIVYWLTQMQIQSMVDAHCPPSTEIGRD